MKIIFNTVGVGVVSFSYQGIMIKYDIWEEHFGLFALANT